jgi:fructokinase
MDPWPDVVCLGELLIDLVAVGDDPSIEHATTFRASAGGAPANVAVGLRRLGVSAGFIGKVSEDAFGRSLRATLKAEAVDLRGLVTDPAARTPLAFVGQGPGDGRTWVFYHRGMADTLLRPDEVDHELIGHARIFHFGSVSLAAEPGRSATLAAARVAREQGCLVSFDPNVRLEVWDDPTDARRTIDAALTLADVVKVSRDEIAFLTDTAEPAAAGRALLGSGPRLVIVTLGDAGAWVSAGTFADVVRAFEVRSVDPTGAGDAFVAGFLSRLLDSGGAARDALAPRDTILEAVLFGNAAGALATTRIGAIPALPTRAEVQELLGKRSGWSHLPSCEAGA